MSLRDSNLERLDGGEFDVVIVGGGINGAVSAAALASRGARVALVDRGDFANFTSQASSNLVWGGFKYLENYELALVRHLCMSRNKLIRSYPYNVKEIGFLAALDETSPYAPQFAFAGAAAYWAIGNAFTKPPRLLSRDKIGREEPAIRLDTVRGGIEYRDAYLVDNDSRFVFGFIRAALNVGASCANYVELVGASQEGPSKRWSVELRDVETGRTLTASAKVLVNAAGPFVDGINAEQQIKSRHRIVYSKGIHLVVPRIAGAERVLAFFDDTQRLFYVIPMGVRSVIGTTDTRVDTPYTEVTEEDRSFLLGQINERLVLAEPLRDDDVISERCGVRPLVVESSGDDKVDTDWTALSRKHATEVDEDRSYITIFGGKLTDCLNVGEEVCEFAERLGVPLEADAGDWYGEPPAATAKEFFRQARLMKLDRLRKRASYETLPTRLWRRYGLRAFAMLEAIRDDAEMAEDVIDGSEYMRVELELAARTEMICHFEDFLRRRSKISMVMRADEIRNAVGIRDAAKYLFGPDAKMRFDAEFGDGAYDATRPKRPEPV